MVFGSIDLTAKLRKHKNPEKADNESYLDVTATVTFTKKPGNLTSVDWDVTIGLLDTLPVPPTIGWHLPPFLRGRLLQQFGNQGIIDIDTSNPRGPYTKDGPTELVSRFGFQPPNAYPGIITARIVSVRALKVQAEVLVPVRGQDMPVKVGLPPELLPAVKHSLCQKGT